MPPRLVIAAARPGIAAARPRLWRRRAIAAPAWTQSQIEHPHHLEHQLADHRLFLMPARPALRELDARHARTLPFAMHRHKGAVALGCLRVLQCTGTNTRTACSSYQTCLTPSSPPACHNVVEWPSFSAPPAVASFSWHTHTCTHAHAQTSQATPNARFASHLCMCRITACTAAHTLPIPLLRMRRNSICSASVQHMQQRCTFSVLRRCRSHTDTCEILPFNEENTRYELGAAPTQCNRA